jgi:cystathionine beta-synthase
MGHDVDAVVCGVGSGGTLTGLSRFFERVSPQTQMVLADPVGSVLCDYIRTGTLKEAGSWVVEGIGEDFIPPIADLSRVSAAYSISDEESLTTARELLRKEGVLGGSSSGTLVAAALRYCREQTEPKRVVTFICDTGNKYLSKMFNDFWMADQGFLRRERLGDLRDLISRLADERAVVTIKPDDKLMTAYARMKLYDISQIPVVDGERVIGLLDEWDLLMAVQDDPDKFHLLVAAAMTQNLESVALNTPLASLIDTFNKGHVALVIDQGKFYGLITRIDVLNYLRLKVH